MAEPCLFCIRCGNIFSSQNQAHIVCPECGFRKDPQGYAEILRYAQEALRFGYLYRKQYEKDYAKRGNLNTRYCLCPASEIFVFLAVSAISGIIGGVSYDVIKKIVSKIKSKISSFPIKYDRKLNTVLNNPAELRIFIQYIKEFYTGLDNINPEIKNAIREEMIIGPISEITAELASQILNKKIKKSKIANLTKSQFEDLIKKRVLAIQKKTHPPKAGDFKNLWKSLKEVSPSPKKSYRKKHK